MTADTEVHHHSLGFFSKSQQSPSSEMLQTLPQPTCSQGAKWTGGEGRQSRGTPGQTETSEILDLSAEKSIWKYFNANTRCCQALLQKYCTQERNRQENIQLMPSCQVNNGKRFHLPKQTSVSSDKPQTLHQELCTVWTIDQQICSPTRRNSKRQKAAIHSQTLPVLPHNSNLHNSHWEPFAHGVFIFLPKNTGVWQPFPPASAGTDWDCHGCQGRATSSLR